MMIRPMSALRRSDPMCFLLGPSIYKHHARSHAASFRAVHSYELDSFWPFPCATFVPVNGNEPPMDGQCDRPSA